MLYFVIENETTGRQTAKTCDTWDEFHRQTLWTRSRVQRKRHNIEGGVNMLLFILAPVLIILKAAGIK